MSKVIKRKHVMNEAFWDDYTLPTTNQTVVKVINSRGNNLHEVITSESETYLVSMPTKFRKNIWVKRGDYVLVEPIEEGDKVRGEIVKILNKDSIKHYKENNVWPQEFQDDKKDNVEVDEDGIFVNTNRKQMIHDTDSSDSCDSETNSSDDDNENSDTDSK